MLWRPGKAKAKHHPNESTKKASTGFKSLQSCCLLSFQRVLKFWPGKGVTIIQCEFRDSIAVLRDFPFCIYNLRRTNCRKSYWCELLEWIPNGSSHMTFSVLKLGLSSLCITFSGICLLCKFPDKKNHLCGWYFQYLWCACLALQDETKECSYSITVCW